ncbi:MAG: hypothetical protein HY928_08505 [Elusimicrobia bacterium]|nr:hypothetical protein [Elusimicrobiota bacterium]
MPTALLLLASVCAAARTAPVGVTLRFPSGGSLEGVLLSESSGAVRIESDGGLIEFSRGELSALIVAPNAHSEFKRREAALPERDAAALWSLSHWALENGLPGWGVSCARKVLLLEPGHPGARGLLAGPAEVRELEGAWVRWDPPRSAPAPARPLPVAPRAQAVHYFLGPTAVRLPPARLELGLAPPGTQTGPGPWRPEPFQAPAPVLGIPPPEPVGSRIGYDPMR